MLMACLARLYKTALSGICLLVAFPGLCAEEESIPEQGSFGLGWLDQTQQYASNSANNLAGKIDRFFGEPRSDLEAAYSSLRISVEQLLHEDAGSSTKLRLRGKVHLP